MEVSLCFLALSHQCFYSFIYSCLYLFIYSFIFKHVAYCSALSTIIRRAAL